MRVKFLSTSLPLCIDLNMSWMRCPHPLLRLFHSHSLPLLVFPAKNERQEDQEKGRKSSVEPSSRQKHCRARNNEIFGLNPLTGSCPSSLKTRRRSREKGDWTVHSSLFFPMSFVQVSFVRVWCRFKGENHSFLSFHFVLDVSVHWKGTKLGWHSIEKNSFRGGGLKGKRFECSYRR